MTVDFDPLDDLLGDESGNSARVVKKFKPKPKLQMQRKVSTQSSVTSTQSVQTVQFPPRDLSEPIVSGKPLEHCSDVMPNAKADFHSFTGKSVEENADILIQPEVLGDFLPHTNTEFTVSPPEVVKQNDPNTETIVGGRETQVFSSIDDSTDRCKVDDVPKDPGRSAEVDVLAAENDLIPSSQHVDAVDLSSLGSSHNLPTESSEIRLDEEVVTLLEEPQLDSPTHKEGFPESRAKLACCRAKTRTSKTNDASDPHFEREKASTLCQVNEAGRSLRPRIGKKSICRLVDEDEDETLGAEKFSEELPYSFTVDEKIVNHEQSQVENESQKKNLKRKSKKTVNDKEKPRKGKKAKEESEQATPLKPKKFPHSTRRRRVDKNLLNIPEEEFDPTQVSLRNLILLAEHKEREMKAGKAVAKAPETRDSAGNSTVRYTDAANNYDAANTYAGDSNDKEGSPIAEDTTEYFNYQSRMEKTARVRWSKTDTEQFYEAVRRFGTDFDIMEKLQIFPGRSRKQIRNKYKKEQREHPMMLGEACTTRSNDTSYYKKVIEDIAKMRAEREKADFSEEEGVADEGATNANDDDKAKPEHVEEQGDNDPVKGEQEEAKAEEEEEGEEEDEDEMYLWNQYKSDV